MDADRKRTVEDLFERLLEEPEADREGVLERLCEGDEVLAEEVMRLLRAHERMDGILDQGPVDLGAPPKEMPGQVIGRYQVIRKIGEGGMGSVFLAERADGHFVQRVALKIIPRVDEALRSRVVAERQILASLEHPHISRLLDGGVTEDGRPFLVMEYVDGLPIDAFCDDGRLGLRERLEVFLTVLSAVDHAHRNLVVHRDLKPSNIMVTPSGEVKLLDFGIAKMLAPGLGEAVSPVTRAEERALTPEYASPEQVRGEAISTATDIYSLGVILYHLLSGLRPYSIGHGGFTELVRTVCDSDPPRPSTRLLSRVAADDGKEAATDRTIIADARRTNLPRLHRALLGDLDSIVMKALRKEPDLRYSSIAVFAQDIRAFLEGRPVAARKGTRWYRLRKMARRHRTAVVAASLIGVSLIGGAGAAIWQGRIASTERDRAQEALRQSEEVTELLMGLFDSSSPEDRPERVPTVLDLLRRGEQRADSIDGEPAVKSRLLQTIARAHQSLGRYGKAEDLASAAVVVIEEEIDPESPLLVPALHRWGVSLKNAARYDSANGVLARAADLGERSRPEGEELLGDVFEEWARVRVYLGDLAGAETLARKGMEHKEEILGANHPSTLNTLATLASIHRFQGRFAEAEGTFREVMVRRRALEDPDLTTITQDMLQVVDLIHTSGGDLTEAERLAREAVALLHDGTGYGHRNFVWGLSSLARVRESQGDLQESESLFRQAVSVRKRTFGDLHPLVAEALGVLGGFLTRIDRPEEAEEFLREAEAVDLQTVGPEHTRYAGTLAGLAKALHAQARLAEADSVVAEAVRIRRVALGPSNQPLASGLTDRAVIWIDLGRYAEAEGLLTEALGMVSEQPRQGRLGLAIHQAFADLYQLWGNLEKAAFHRAEIEGSG